MVTFRNNNNRRNNFRRNERGFKSNGDRNKFSANFSSNDNFQRKMPGRNNHNASKLIEKYSNLALKIFIPFALFLCCDFSSCCETDIPDGI